MARSRLILLLAAVAAMSPLAIDLYLPAIPSIATDFEISTDKIAVTVSLYMLGLALGQLIGGPLSDNLGRKPVMVFGQLMFAASSALMVFSPTWQVFWALRIVQALGAGLTMVGVPAIIRDHSEGAESARMMASIALIMIAAPAIAPTLGSVMLLVGNWHFIFAFQAMYALLMALAVLYRLPTSQPATPPANKPSLLRGYAEVLSNRSALGFMLAQTCAFTVMLTFVTNASYVYQEHFALSNGVFSALFACNIVLMAIMNRVNVRWLRQHEPEQLARRGIAMQAIAVAGLLISTVLLDSLLLTAICIIGAIGAQGAIAPNTNAAALRFFKHNSGVASATLGTMQFTLSALISAFSTRFQSTGEIWPMALVMASAVVLGASGLHLGRRSLGTLQPSQG